MKSGAVDLSVVIFVNIQGFQVHGLKDGGPLEVVRNCMIISKSFASLVYSSHVGPDWCPFGWSYAYIPAHGYLIN